MRQTGKNCHIKTLSLALGLPPILPHLASSPKIHFFPQLPTDGNDSDGKPASSVLNPPLLPSNSEPKTLDPPSVSAPESPRRNTRSRLTNTQVWSTPTPGRSTRVRFAPVGGTSEDLPAPTHTVSSRDTPRASIIARGHQRTNTDSTEEGCSKDVTPTAIPRIRLVLKERPHEATPDSSTASESTDVKELPKDVTPVIIPRIRLVINKRTREDSPDSNSASDSANSKERPKEVAPIATPKIRLVINKSPRGDSVPSRTRRETATDSANVTGRSENLTPSASPVRIKFVRKQESHQSALDSIPPANRISSEFPSYSLSSNLDPDQLKPIENTSVESSFIPESKMDSPKHSASNKSHEPSSDHDEESTSINPTSELPATSASTKPRSSSDEAPFGDTGYRSPTLDFVPSTPPNPTADPDPSMDPYQPSNSMVMPDITPFEDPNLLPSTFMYPEETPDYSDCTIDPMGVYTPEEYARILASEQELLREMADPHTDDPPYLNAREDVPHFTTLDDLDRIFADMEADAAGIEILRPEYWASIGRDQREISQPDASESSHSQHSPAQLGSDQPAHAKVASPDPREMSQVPSQTLQSVEEPDPGLVAKRARHSSSQAKSTTPETSITASTRTSVSVRQGRSASFKTKTATPPSTATSTRHSSKNKTVTPAPTSALTRQRSKTNIKTEVATPEPQVTVKVTVSPRRLRSSDIAPTPSSSTKKNGKGNATPDSWETAPMADKMMSQMKQTSISWTDITAAWNDNRPESDGEMTWRALSKRWGRIKTRIGIWPGFDKALVNALRAFDLPLDDDGFAQIAGEVSTELGWEVPGAACQSRYETLKESGKLNVKGKGRARK
ncbi:unnamed protein product [Penicillium glandicola]